MFAIWNILAGEGVGANSTTDERDIWVGINFKVHLRSLPT